MFTMASSYILDRRPVDASIRLQEWKLQHCVGNMDMHGPSQGWSSSIASSGNAFVSPDATDMLGLASSMGLNRTMGSFSGVTSNTIYPRCWEQWAD